MQKETKENTHSLMQRLKYELQHCFVVKNAIVSCGMRNFKSTFI